MFKILVSYCALMLEDVVEATWQGQDDRFQLVVKVLASPANFLDALMCGGFYRVKPD